MGAEPAFYFYFLSPKLIQKLSFYSYFTLTCNTRFFHASFRTTLCLQYLPNCVADSALFLAIISMGLIPINTEKTWPQLIDTDLEMETLKG
jgi:hypothetical protein